MPALISHCRLEQHPTIEKIVSAKDSELGDVKFFLEKLINTGFLD